MFQLTADGEKILYVLVEEDAQGVAEEHLGRKLTEEELQDIKKGLEHGFDNWAETIQSILTETLNGG